MVCAHTVSFFDHAFAVPTRSHAASELRVRWLFLAERKGRNEMACFHYRIVSGKKGTAAQRISYITRKGKYRNRGDLEFAGSGNLPTWAANDPLDFWRAADKAERSNGAVYREHRIALPNELSRDQQEELVDRLVSEVVGCKPFQYAVHVSKASLGDVPNTHLHLVQSDRMPDGIGRDPEQTFRRYNRHDPAKGGCRKDSGGRTRMEVRNAMIATRKAIADAQNAILAKYGHTARVDHRSLKAQGKTKKAERHLGPARIREMEEEGRKLYRAAREYANSPVNPISPL